MLTGYADGCFRLHDPNGPGGADTAVAEDAFARMWTHPDTDNDLSIVTGERR